MVSDVLGAVRQLLPAIAAAAAATDRSRRVDPALIEGLGDAGVFRMMAPARFGGLESSPAELMAVVRAVSAACASTGWVVSSLAISSWQVALFDESAQEEVWAEAPGRLIASSYQPAGQLRPHGSGFRLSGLWRNLSGCEHSEWVFLGALVLDELGDPVEHGLALIRTADIRMAAGAECVGLRAAANTDVVVEDVFVPADRVYEAGRRLRKEGRRTAAPRSPLYRQSLAVLFSTALTMPLIGAAEGAYAAIVEQLQSASGPNLPGGRSFELGSVGAAIGRADAEIAQAARQLSDVLAEVSSIAGSAAGVVTLATQLRARRDQVLAGELATSAIDRILKLGGRRALLLDSPIQRAWRDIHVGASHRVNEVESVLGLFGRRELGLDVESDVIFL